MKQLHKCLRHGVQCLILGVCLTVLLCWFFAAAVPVKFSNGLWTTVDHFPRPSWETTPPTEFSDLSSRTQDKIAGHAKISRSWERVLLLETGEIVTQSELDERLKICMEVTMLLAQEAAQTNPGGPLPEVPNCSYNIESLTYFIVDDAFGWPFEAMRTTRAGVSSRSKVSSPFQLTATAQGLSNPLTNTWFTFKPASNLPLVPIWTGFVANVIFWTVCMASLAFSWSSIKRAWRRHRGICVQCCYAVRQLPICPECGTPSKVS